jgi:hypothetical protein
MKITPLLLDVLVKISLNLNRPFDIRSKYVITQFFHYYHCVVTSRSVISNPPVWSADLTRFRGAIVLASSGIVNSGRFQQRQQKPGRDR